MREITEQKYLPYSVQQLFDLVADIERYHEFLPWCRQSRILTQQAGSCQAELLVGNRFIRQGYRSHIAFQPHETITATLLDGPLEAMENRWRFTPCTPSKMPPHTQSACVVDFYLAFTFDSTLLSSMMNKLFEQAFMHMMSAFEKRAHDLYQPQDSATMAARADVAYAGRAEPL